MTNFCPKLIREPSCSQKTETCLALEPVMNLNCTGLLFPSSELEKPDLDSLLKDNPEEIRARVILEAQPPIRPSPRGLTPRKREEWGNMGVTSPPATTEGQPQP